MRDDGNSAERLKVKIMNDQKLECTDDLITRLHGSGRFRRDKHTLYPLDARNLTAADMLEKLAAEMTLSDEDWALLEPHYQSKAWPKAINQAARQVNFSRHPRTAAAFVQLLVKNLNEHRVVA